LNSFTFWSPTKIVFGKDTVSKTGKEVKAFGGTNTLVFYGKGSAVKSGVLDAVIKSLEAEGIKTSCVGGVQANPLLEFAQKAVEEYKEKGIDFVLGVGGGSVIDTAKAVAHGLATPDVPIWDIFTLKTDLKKSLPIGTVLTIAAAGSEMSDSAVLTNQEACEKRGLSHQLNRAKFAIMDPTLTYSLPPHHTACGVTDTLMHTLDRYFTSDTGNAVTDELAEALMRVIIKYGRIVMENPLDYKARAEMMWAGSLSHNGLTGLGQMMDFSTHRLGAPFSAKYDSAHGDSLSAVWPAWAKHVYQRDIPRFARYARNVWNIKDDKDETAAKAGITATEEYFKSLGMPVTITELADIKDDNEIDTLANLCTFNGTRIIGALKVLDAQDIKSIYKSAL